MDIVLVGNPNVGKSVIFNSLTGSYVTVSNYPGTTVDVSRGVGKFAGHKCSVIDTPGVNSLVVHSEDERVTKDILSRPGIDRIVQVADAKNLKRSLMLTLELMKFNIPLVLSLNMSDEAKERGISIDAKRLSRELGIEVIETIAVTGEGIARLKEAIIKAKAPNPVLASLVTERSTDDNILLLKKRDRIVGNLIKEILVFSKPLKKRVSELIGNIAVKPITGIPLLILVLIFMYLFVGKLAAGKGVDFLENVVFGKYINPALTGIVDRYIHISVVKDMLVGDYGIITMAFTYAFAIILPIVTAFFLFFGILEDSGYIPRLTVLSDRAFKIMGLNGRAVLPMILGLGCGTMAILTARILDTKKERILVSLLLTLAIPCSAQLGIVMGMLGGLSLKALLIWVSIMLSIALGVGWAASKVIPGTRSPFIQEIPPIRMPQLGNIVVKTLARLKWYLKEAVPLFILGTLVLFALSRFGALGRIEKMLSPVVVNLLSLPQKVTEAFIIGFLRRDYGAAGLYALAKTGALDKIQIFVSLVVITLFVPCIAQFFVMIKERGAKTAGLIGAFVFIFAFLIGYVLNIALRYLTFNLGIAVL